MAVDEPRVAQVGLYGTLTDEELRSSAWKKIEKLLKERLDLHHKKNKNPRLDHDATQLVRGRISEVEYLMTLAKPGPLIEGADDSQY